MSTHAPGPGLSCAGRRVNAAGSVPGGIRGIHQIQHGITRRYIQATHQSGYRLLTPYFYRSQFDASAQAPAGPDDPGEFHLHNVGDGLPVHASRNGAVGVPAESTCGTMGDVVLYCGVVQEVS